MDVYICKMRNENLDLLSGWHDRFKEEGVPERRVTLDDLMPILHGLDKTLFRVSVVGSSFEERPIHRVDFGTGKNRILIWTQMHGNESTGTRAVMDLFRWVQQPGELVGLRDQLLLQVAVTVLPILNPDGAWRYTRVNSQEIDLNRDVIDRKAPESRLLQEQLALVDPHYCFNLHDQRTIFSVGNPPQTATISFLAPSEDEERTVTEGRIRTMRVISGIFESLKELIPGRIGRYTDEFYPTATGDNFQRMGYSTILIESGHFQGDYSRLVSRKMTFMSLVEGMREIVRTVPSDHHRYFDIPNNEKRYLDAIVKDVLLGQEKSDLGIFLKEELCEDKVCFRPTLEKFEDLSSYSADRVLDGSHLVFESREDAEKWVQIEFN